MKIIKSHILTTSILIILAHITCNKNPEELEYDIKGLETNNEQTNKELITKIEEQYQKLKVNPPKDLGKVKSTEKLKSKLRLLNKYMTLENTYFVDSKTNEVIKLDGKYIIELKNRLEELNEKTQNKIIEQIKKINTKSNTILQNNISALKNNDKGILVLINKEVKAINNIKELIKEISKNIKLNEIDKNPQEITKAENILNNIEYINKKINQLYEDGSIQYIPENVTSQTKFYEKKEKAEDLKDDLEYIDINKMIWETKDISKKENILDLVNKRNKLLNKIEKSNKKYSTIYNQEPEKYEHKNKKNNDINKKPIRLIIKESTNKNLLKQDIKDLEKMIIFADNDMLDQVGIIENSIINPKNQIVDINALVTTEDKTEKAIKYKEEITKVYNNMTNLPKGNFLINGDKETIFNSENMQKYLQNTKKGEDDLLLLFNGLMKILENFAEKDFKKYLIKIIPEAKYQEDGLFTKRYVQKRVLNQINYKTGQNISHYFVNLLISNKDDEDKIAQLSKSIIFLQIFGLDLNIKMQKGSKKSFNQIIEESNEFIVERKQNGEIKEIKKNKLNN